MKNAIVKHMSVNHHISPFMNRCRLLAMLLMLALALPMIGQTTTYTYQKSKGKSTRPLQKDTTYGYQKQVTHEDRVVIYRQPSSTSFMLWRNAEAFITYARWYDYTTDQSIPNIQKLWKSSGKNNVSVQSDTLSTNNHGVIWYHSTKSGSRYQANAEYVYNPGTNDNQVQYIACDQSKYTDWSIDNTTFTEPTISQRMVFEIHPASEMAARVEACTEGKWLEEYDIMAPTGQNIYLGPKYAFIAQTFNTSVTGMNSQITGQSYPSYFYKDIINGSIQQMDTKGFSGNNGSSVIGNWVITNSSINTTIVYVCDSTYSVKDASGHELTGNKGDTTPNEPDAAVAHFWTKKTTTKKIIDYKKIDNLIAEGPGWIWLENGTMGSPAIISGQYVNIGSQQQPNTITYQLIYALGNNTCTTTYYKTECTTIEIDSIYNTTWQLKEKPKEKFEILHESSQTTNTNSQNKIYKIAQFKIQYFYKSIVGPVSQKMGDFVNNMEIIAEQNFNFGYSENNKLPITDKVTRFYWTTPLSEEESTYGFYYGSTSDRATNYNTNYCAFNEYQFVNDGFGWTKNDSVANHVGNGKGYNKETGFALYADGSQKAGTVFSIDFGADLCPGAKMYFSAWIGDQNKTTDSKYVKGFPIFNFYVEGIDEAGDAHTLATFTIGEFKQQNNGWHYILFPLEFGDDIDYEKFSFRIENMAASSNNNDFFLDDVRVYLQRAAISPIQASISNDASCLVSNGTMMLYTRVDCYTDNVDLENTDVNTRSFYYRWYDKDGNIVENAAYYNKSTDINGKNAYGKVSIHENANNIDTQNDTLSNFKRFDNTAHNSPIALFKYINEQCLNPNLSVENRYVVYVATPVPVELGQSYRCILANAASSLPIKADSVTGKEKCTSDAIVQIVHGLCIRSEKLGGFVTDDSQANANVSYELSLVSESITHTEGIANKNVSCYYGFWLFGRKISAEEYNAKNKIKELEALYGAPFDTVKTAIIAYIGNVSLKDNTVNCTQKQKDLVNRLVSMGALRLSNTNQLSDTSFLVLPLYTSDTISYTVFPVWDLGGTATECHDPLTISLYFQKSIPIEGEEGEQQTFVRNAISFVKSADETLPTFMHNLRARRVRIPRDSVQKYVQLKMTDTTSHYTVKHATLIETTNTNTTATEPLFKRINSWVDTENVQPMTGNGPFRVCFKDLNQLPEGYSYTFRMDYDIHDVNTQLDTTYNGEAFITFMVVPDVLFYNGTYNDGWNDDSKWQYKDLTAKKLVESMVPLHNTKIVVTGNNNRKLAVKPAVKTENNVQLLPVETNAQPYITYDIGYEPYACSEVFLYGAYEAVLGQHYLHTIDENGDTIPPKWTYEAWPDKNKWKFFSVPIKGVVLGDMFVPAKYESSSTYKDNNNSDPNELFSVRSILQTPGTAADDRTVYSFYNSMYNKETKQYFGGGIYKDITTSTWTYATNALDTPITAGFGWALGLMTTRTENPPLIRLPKKDTVYHFFKNNTWVGESVKINRTKDLGRPMLKLDEYDNMNITLENNESSKYFLFGNPTFASIDLGRLLAANKSIKGLF